MQVLSKVIKVKYKGGVLVPEEPLNIEENKELLVKIIDVKEREKVVEQFYGKRGPAPKELLDEFMLEAEAQ